MTTVPSTEVAVVAEPVFPDVAAVSQAGCSYGLTRTGDGRLLQPAE